jgi:hypothetical protein
MENAINYLTILLQDIENTTNFLTAYHNLILNIKYSHSPDGLKDWNIISRELQSEEKEQLIDKVAMFRAYATRTKIKFSSIAKYFKGDKKEKANLILDDYEEIKKNPLPNFDKCSSFVQSINDLFVDEINVQVLLNAPSKQISSLNTPTNY